MSGLVGHKNAKAHILKDLFQPRAMSHQLTIINEPVHEKTNNLGSDQVRHKPGCTVTEAG